MKEVLNNFLVQRGYFNAMTTLPEFMVHFIPAEGNVEVVMSVDYQKEIYLTEEIYNTIREKFIKSFMERGFTNVHILTLVMCKDIERISPIFEKDSFSWYIDIKESKLNIPDGHVEDFYGLKAKIETFLTNPNLYELKEEDIKEETSFKIKEIPLANSIFVAINILVFILCAFNPEVLYNKGAFSYSIVESTKEYYRFITSVFIHADVDHLFSNMLVLFFLGNSVEKKIGHVKYFLLFFISAIAGNIVSAAYESYFNQMYLSVGASGAVYGILGAVLLLVVVKGGSWETITLPRMLLMLGYSLYSGFMMTNINNAAHIGGFVSGLFVMGLFCVVDKLRKKKEVFHEN